MQISKEDFKKLKQLDRIEYFLKKDKLNRNKPEYDFSGFVAIFVISGFVIILSLLFFNIDKSIAIDLIKTIPLIFRIFIFVMTIYSIYFMFKLINYKQNLIKLESEFFTIEVRK